MKSGKNTPNTNIKDSRDKVGSIWLTLGKVFSPLSPPNSLLEKPLKTRRNGAL